MARKDINNFKSNLPRIKDSVDPKELLKAIKRTIEKVITIHLGVRPGLLSDDLIEAVIFDLISKFSDFTTKDIEWSYERFNFKKRDDWRMVTKSEILEPIQSWAYVRVGIMEEFEKFQQQQKEESEAESKILQFKKESRIIYNKCVDELEWTGSIFHASAIAKDLAVFLDQETKDEFWVEAKKESKQTNEENDKIKRLGGSIDVKRIGRTPERVYSELIVIESIKNGQKLL